ncbi:MAG: two-component regulator propeller domain-containing protein [Pseudomonadota bacterium]
MTFPRTGRSKAWLGDVVLACLVLLSACTTGHRKGDSAGLDSPTTNLTAQSAPDLPDQRNPDLEPGPIPPIALAPPVAASLTRAQLTNPDTNTALVVGLPGAACVKGLKNDFCNPEDNVTEVCVKDVTQNLDIVCQIPADNGAFSFTLIGAKENDEVKIWTNGPSYLPADENSLNAIAKTIVSVSTAAPENATAILRSGPWIFVGSESEGLYIYKQDPAGAWPQNTTRVQRLTIGDGLRCNNISALAQASGKKVWVGSKCGLRRIDFDPDRNLFSLDGTFRIKDGDGAGELLTRPVYSLLDDGPNAAWVGKQTGWMRIEAGADGEFVSSANVPTSKFGTSPYTVDESGLANRLMTYDDNHDLWVSGGYKLRRLRPDGTTEEFPIEGVGRLMTISSLIRDGDHLWISLVWNVLLQVHFTTDPVTGYRRPDFKRIPIVDDNSSDPIFCGPSGPCTLPDDDIPFLPSIFSLAPVGDGSLYVGTAGTVRHAVFGADARVDADIFARELGADETRVLVGDGGGGVYAGGRNGFGFIQDPDQGKFERYTNPTYLLSNKILSLGAATPDTIWVGQPRGLSRVDVTRNLYAHHPIEEGSKGFSMIASDGAGGAWAYHPQDFGLSGWGISALVHAAVNTENVMSTGLIDLGGLEGAFGKTMALYPTQSGGVSIALFRGVFEARSEPLLGLEPVPVITPKSPGTIRAMGTDDLGRLWIVTQFECWDLPSCAGNEIRLVDVSTSQTYRITEYGDLQVTQGNSVIPDGRGGLLIGSNHGILRFRAYGGNYSMEPTIHLYADRGSDRVQALQLAGDGKFWAATAKVRSNVDRNLDWPGGLYLVQLGETETRITRFAAADYGLPSDEILSLAGNSDGSVWVGTDNGLALFVPPPLQ